MEYSPKLAAALLLALTSAMIVTAQNDDADYMVNAHNEVRAAVGVGPVTWRSEERRVGKECRL